MTKDKIVIPNKIGIEAKVLRMIYVTIFLSPLWFFINIEGEGNALPPLQGKIIGQATIFQSDIVYVSDDTHNPLS